MPHPKLFRDPVHIQIRFERVDLQASPPKSGVAQQFGWVAQKIIETRSFQRLRFIRQNAMANLAYHGAEHSRFTHSLGVAHLADLMHQKIIRNTTPNEINEQLYLATLTAALLHDIGHGPFSHTFEEIIGKDKFDHERMTRRYITEPDSEINEILVQVDPTFPELVGEFFNKKRKVDHWAYKIVSSQLDADRLDYLLRDSLFAGLKGPAFDIERILDLLMHHNNAIGVHKRGEESIEAYLVTLDIMYRAVYYHHTVRSAQSMLSTLFRRAKHLSLNGDAGVFGMPSAQGNLIKTVIDEGDNIDLQTFSRLSEVHVWYMLHEWTLHRDPILSSIADRILRRDLFVAIDIKSELLGEYDQIKEQAEKAAKQLMPGVPDAADYLVVLDEPQRTSYKTYNWKPKSQDDSIWLIDEKNPEESIPIENFTGRNLVNGLKETRYFSRLVMPANVREKVQPSEPSLPLVGGATGRGTQSST